MFLDYYLNLEEDGLPKIEDLSDVWEDGELFLTTEIVTGVLNINEKMLICGNKACGVKISLQELALAVSNGLSWFGKSTNPVPVTYMCLDNKYQICKAEFVELSKAMGLENPVYPNIISPQDKITDVEDIRYYIDLFLGEEVYNGLIVIENINQVFYHCDDILQAINCLNRICEDYNSAMVYGVGRLPSRHSVTITRDPETLINLVKEKKSNELVRVEIEMRHRESIEPFLLNFNGVVHKELE